MNFVIFHFVKSSLPFPGFAQRAGELYRVLYLISLSTCGDITLFFLLTILYIFL